MSIPFKSLDYESRTVHVASGVFEWKSRALDSRPVSNIIHNNYRHVQSIANHYD